MMTRFAMVVTSIKSKSKRKNNPETEKKSEWWNDFIEMIHFLCGFQYRSIRVLFLMCSNCEYNSLEVTKSTKTKYNLNGFFSFYQFLHSLNDAGLIVNTSSLCLFL